MHMLYIHILLQQHAQMLACGIKYALKNVSIYNALSYSNNFLCHSFFVTVSMQFLDKKNRSGFSSSLNLVASKIPFIVGPK